MDSSGNNNPFNSPEQAGAPNFNNNQERPIFETPQPIPANQAQQTIPNYPQNNPYQPQAQPMTMPQMPSAQQIVANQKPKKSHVLEILLIIFIFIIGAGAIGGAAYCQSQFSALNANVMTDRSNRANEAMQAQKIIDDKAYENRNASDTREFTGPSDFGALTFKYPKTWKVYLENNDDSNPTYTAYFSPDYVPPNNGSYNYALIFKLQNIDYDKYLQSLSQKKLISIAPIYLNGLTGSKATGKLDDKEEQANGSEAIIKVNDYTAILRTDDYDKYGEEFDTILQTLTSAHQ